MTRKAKATKIWNKSVVEPNNLKPTPILTKKGTIDKTQLNVPIANWNGELMWYLLDSEYFALIMTWILLPFLCLIVGVLFDIWILALMTFIYWGIGFLLLAYLNRDIPSGDGLDFRTPRKTVNRKGFER